MRIAEMAKMEIQKMDNANLKDANMAKRKAKTKAQMVSMKHAEHAEESDVELIRPLKKKKCRIGEDSD